MMSSHDTFYKLRDNIYPGMKLQHRFRRPDNSFDWFCTINKIDPEHNILKVTITSNHGHSHSENWDMAITAGGIADGEYLEIT